jgi:probable rRNA maturation factor
MVYLDNRTRGSGLDARALADVLERLLAEIGERGSSVSLTFVRDPAMRELNRAHRGKDTATDVLSFPLYSPDAFDRVGATRPRPHQALPLSSSKGQDDRAERMLGDIVVSVDTARRQAAEYDATLGREVQRLLVHGVLHLAGHDHLESGERAVMEAEERRLADAIGMPWPYLESSAS